MADYGIKIMLQGYDISTVPNSAANIKKFAMVSIINLLKIKTAAKVNLGNGVSTTIPHGFSYYPLYWVFMKNASSQMVPIYNETNVTSAYVDATNLFIRNNNGAARDFYYYIFYDPMS